jgi:hypothetical protein
MTAAEVYESLLDVREFARRLVGEPLWPHQEAVAMSLARTRVMNCGRQAGKSRTLAVLALHGAFTHSEYRVLILSAGEDSAKDLLAEISALASSSLLAGSVVDDNASLVTLSNRSTIRCVPASQKQARGKSINLLILDEAAQIADELWRAARYSIIARPESRVVMASTPFGSRQRFFGQAYSLGRAGAENYESFHWPSQISPLVDDSLLQDWRRTDPEWVYRQEVLAEFVEDSQAYFTADELLDAVAEYDMWSPERVRDVTWNRGQFFGGAAGLDWGFSNDSSAVALVAPLEDHDLNAERLQGQLPLFVPYVEISQPRTRYTDWIDRLVQIGQAMTVRSWASEVNGIGLAPTQILQERLARLGMYDSWVFEVNTTNRRKQAGFGQLKVLLQQGRLALPRHSELLRQLQALEFTYSEKTGSVQISVPERVGHDDAALALMQSVSCVAPHGYSGREAQFGAFDGDIIETPGGLRMPANPRPRWDTSAIHAPAGMDRSQEPGW